MIELILAVVLDSTPCLRNHAQTGGPDAGKL